MHFTKMHGLGNDYIYLDCMETAPPDLPALAVRLSDRHFGVGGDGVICLCPSHRADFRMRIFNADGSEGEMCGNGIRCAAKLAYEKGLCRRRELTVETPAGMRQVSLRFTGGAVTGAEVDMGVPAVEGEQSVSAQGEVWRVTPVSMGNPHGVVFIQNVGTFPVERVGPAIGSWSGFPRGANVEFAEVLSRERLQLRVWERGSGETLACGTGACAAFAAAREKGLVGDRVTARLPGGELELAWTAEGRVRMSGGAVLVFEGELPEGGGLG